jgi:hypothetical protein
MVEENSKRRDSNKRCHLFTVIALLEDFPELADQRGPDYQTPCQKASYNSFSFPVLTYLIQFGADFNKSWDLFSSPLQIAVYNKNQLAVSLLFAAGADSLVVTNDRKTLFNLATEVRWTGAFETATSERTVQLAGFGAIRARATEICVALQDLELDATRLSEIVIQSCTPFAERLEFHFIWDLVTTVKHFKERQQQRQQKLLMKLLRP